MTPAKNLLLAATGLALLGLIVVWWPALTWVWKAGLAILAGLALIDLLQVRQIESIEVERRVRHSIPVAVWSKVDLQLENPQQRSLYLKLHDHHPPDFEVEDLPLTILLPAERALQVDYRVRPTSRGDAQFRGIELVLRSPLCLWWQRRFLQQPEHVRVFPNFREISHYVLLATDNHLSNIGVHRRPRRGEGSDFHQLREYRRGDSLRQIDWKASSRYRRPISREYQDERDQQLVFMLDCGRHMRQKDDKVAHLDQALNAMLLLTHVADRQGDAVGLMTFGGDRRWLPPQKGGNQVRRLLDYTYDVHSKLAAADYLEAVQTLMPLQQRRALVVILTNTRGEDREGLRAAVKLLRRRHLVVVADLREENIEQTVSAPITGLDEALRFQAVCGYLAERDRDRDSLIHLGALTLDLLPAQLPVSLVNKYLEIKASGRL